MTFVSLYSRTRISSTGYVKLRFSPVGVQDSEQRLMFSIFSNTTSQELEPQGDVPVSAHVIKRAEISIKG